jgi:hypothetical protein
MKYLLNLVLIVTALITGCGGGESEGPEEPAKIIPDVALLTFPEQNAICISGTGSSAIQNTVTFKWTAAKNAERYDVSVKNLVSGISTIHSSVQPELAITISRGTPFSWFVISKSSDGSTTNSAVWKFYNSNEGSLSSPPFPVDEMTPSLGRVVTPENGKIKLSWKGSDPDNDIVNYEIYFSATANPALLKGTHTTDNLPDVAVAAKTKYFWKIVTRDAKGNTSESETLQFTTD